MKYDGILFDLDGTLWNATLAIWESWKLALKDVPDVERPPTVQELEGVMGMTPEILMKTLYPHLSEERGLELFDRCCEVENEYLRKNGGILYEGLEEMLEALSKVVPLFIVSNCNDGYIPCFLEAHQLECYFTDWECNGVTGLLKDGNIRLVVERNHLQRPVYVGDTIIDSDAAEKAG
ncbi:MAG: HAD family hydrolase, partial [Acutalibacter sp.]|nr:HAD family hydrolase [Acutalibacter sp.]